MQRNTNPQPLNSFTNQNSYLYLQWSTSGISFAGGFPKVSLKQREFKKKPKQNSKLQMVI